MLLTKKVAMPTKYLDFADIFSEKSTNVLAKRTKANKHAIELEKGKQPAYGPIYSLGPVEFKTPKTYIETNLANGFIWASKLLSGTPIPFVHKSAFACMSITEDSITSQLKIGIHYY